MKKAIVTDASDQKNESGNVLAYTVISALFLFFAVGLGVDISHMYLAKAELQNAADAAALAGASALTLPNPQRITTAVDRAVNTMNLNKYNFNNRNFSDTMTVANQRALVRFAVNLSEFDNGGTGQSEATATANPVNIRFVKVTTPTVPISIIFANPLLGGSQSLSAKAVSGLSIPGNVRFCPAPLSAVQCDPADAACALASEFQGTCPTSGIQTYTDGTPNCDPTKQFCKGCTYTIRYSGGSGPSPGNYNALDCGGLLRDNLAAYGECRCGNVSVGDSVPIDTKTGVNAGPVAGGLNVRFDIYGNGLKQSDWASMPPDSNIYEGTSSTSKGVTTWTGLKYSDYLLGTPATAPAETGVANRRILVLPLILNTQFSNGKTNVQIAAMGGFFMQNQADNSNGDIKVEYVGTNTNGVVGGDPNGGGATNIVTPVLYR